MQANECALPKITLGWELEATRRALRTVPGVEVDHDGSVNGESLEYRIRRALVFNPSKSLEALRILSTDPGIQVDDSCGFHVHVGLGKKTRKLQQWAAWFVTLARELEPYAFQAVPSSRRHNDRYCRSWKASATSVLTKQYSGSKHSNEDRYNWVNQTEIFRPGGIRTVEIRLMGDCKRYTYLLSWIACCRLMAFSAWALIFDPSRLEQEKLQLAQAFNLVRDNFQTPGVSSATVAKTALYLANKALLVHPFGNPLAGLRKAEDGLFYYERLQEQEREHLDNTLGEMLEAMRASRRTVGERVREARANARPYVPGDTVECVRDPEDGNMTIGRLYRVDGCGNGIVHVTGDNGDGWNVRIANVRLAERITETCAV